MLEQGVDARVVMEILGPRRSPLTQDTHQHVMAKVIADATERVGGVLISRVATSVAPPARIDEAAASSAQVRGV